MDKPKESTKDLDKLEEYALLYDFYGALLKEGHRRMFEDYMLNDLSLSEIAEECGISRQGVYDVIKRSIKKLLIYEDKLGLLAAFNQASERAVQIKAMIREMKETGSLEHLDQIERFVDEITD